MRAKPRPCDRQEITSAPKVGDEPAPEILAVRPKTAMKMIDVGASTFFKLVRQQEIDVVRLGPGLTLVPVASLRAFLARHAAA